MHHCLRGPNSCFPISGVSKRQPCVSHSTPEAELVAMCLALRGTGLPGLMLWHTLLRHTPKIVLHEDNQPMIRVLETGKNPTMRHLMRTHRVSVGWLHESYLRNDFKLVYEETTSQCADIYTKAFTDVAKWEKACWLINVVDPKAL